MSKGVILLSLGYPMYGNWAGQLAASIHFSAPEVEICLLTDGKGSSEIPEQFLKHFSKTIQVDKSIYEGSFLRAKTFLYDLSPYEETIFLDADMIWLPYKPLTELFTEFKDIDYTMSSRSDKSFDTAHDTMIHWAKCSEIREKFTITDKTLYNVSSEFIYFKKTDKVKAFFDLVKKFYDNPEVTYRDFGMQVPDELAYILATLHSDIKPHKSPFVPIYWEQYHRKRLNLQEMYSKFYGYSLGGNITDPLSKETFDNLAKMYSQRMNLKWWYPARNKKDFVLERIHL